MSKLDLKLSRTGACIFTICLAVIAEKAAGAGGAWGDCSGAGDTNGGTLQPLGQFSQTARTGRDAAPVQVGQNFLISIIAIKFIL